MISPCTIVVSFCVSCRVVDYRPPGYGICNAQHCFPMLCFMSGGRLSTTRVWYRLCSALLFRFVFHVGWSVIDLPGMSHDMSSNVLHFAFDLAVDVGKPGRPLLGGYLGQASREVRGILGGWEKSQLLPSVTYRADNLDPKPPSLKRAGPDWAGGGLY